MLSADFNEAPSMHEARLVQVMDIVYRCNLTPPGADE
jgi:hypothetical protein